MDGMFHAQTGANDSTVSCPDGPHSVNLSCSQRNGGNATPPLKELKPAPVHRSKVIHSVAHSVQQLFPWQCDLLSRSGLFLRDSPQGLYCLSLLLKQAFSENKWSSFSASWRIKEMRCENLLVILFYRQIEQNKKKTVQH